MLLPRAVAIVPSIAVLRSQPGPALARYFWVLELGASFRWALNSLALDDGFTAIVPNVGGFQGAWLRMRTTERGPDIAAADFTAHAATVGVASGYWQVITPASLTGASTITLDPAGAVAGDWKEFTREDTTGNTLAFVNGGPAAGTLTTMPVSARAYARFDFDGTNFVRRTSGLLL